MEINKNKRLVKNIASLGIVQIANYIFPLLTIPYVSRIIGPEGFGIINYITAFISYFILVINYGFDLSATRKIAVAPDDSEIISRVFSGVFFARLLLLLVSLLLFFTTLPFAPIVSTNKMLASIMVLNILASVFTPQYIYQGTQKLSVLSLMTLLKGIINTALIFLVVSQRSDIELYAGILVLGNLLVSLVAFTYAIIKFRIKLHPHSLKAIWQILKEGRLIFFSSIVFSMYTTANTIILGLFDTERNIGFYTTAVGFIAIVQNIINVPLSSSLFPYVGQAFSVNRENGLQKLRKIVPIIFYITLAVSIGLLLFSPFVIPLVYGRAFGGAVIAVQLLCILPLLSGMSSLMAIQTMLNLSMDKLFLKITFYASIFSIGINFLLSYRYHYIGTSISYLITEIIIMISLYIALKKHNIIIFQKEFFSLRNILLFLRKK